MPKNIDATFYPSSFGGGWLVAETANGRDWLESYFNDAPAFLMPIEETGWIVEPCALSDLAEAAQSSGITIYA